MELKMISILELDDCIELLYFLNEDLTDLGLIDTIKQRLNDYDDKIKNNRFLNENIIDNICLSNTNIYNIYNKPFTQELVLSRSSRGYQDFIMDYYFTLTLHYRQLLYSEKKNKLIPLKEEAFEQIIKYRQLTILNELKNHSRIYSRRITRSFNNYKINRNWNTKDIEPKLTYQKIVRIKNKNELNTSKNLYSNIILILKKIICIENELDKKPIENNLDLIERNSIIETLLKNKYLSFIEILPDYRFYHIPIKREVDIVSIRFLTRLKPIKLEKFSDITIQIKKDIEEGKTEINPEKACILLSCKPLNQLAGEIHKYNSDFDLEKTQKAIKIIETILHREFIHNIHRLGILGGAIKVANPILTYKEIFKLIEPIGKITDSSIRKIVKLYNNIKKSNLKELYPIYDKIVSEFKNYYPNQSILKISKKYNLNIEIVRNILLLEYWNYRAYIIHILNQ